MSVYTCAECTLPKDSDYIVCHEYAEDLVCDDCWDDLQEGLSCLGNLWEMDTGE